MSIQKQIEKAKALPIKQKESWVMERRSVELPIEELEDVFKPDVLICISPEIGEVFGTAVIYPDAPESEVVDWALGCMLKPMAGKPHRPGSIALTGGKLKHLQEMLEQLDISVTATSFPDPVIDEVIAAFEHDLGEPGFPPYTIRKGVDPAKVADFFSAAAEFYKLKPWKLFEYEMPVKVEIQRKKKVDYWAVVMGVGGEQFGLSLYRSADDVIELFESEDQEEAIRITQRIWSCGFSYEDVDEIGPAAESEYVSNKWAIAGKSAYPSAIVLDPKSKELVQRPSNKELVDLAIITRALVDFFRANHKYIKDEYTVSDVVQVEVAGEQIQAVISLPAPELLDEDEEEIEDMQLF